MTFKEIVKNDVRQVFMNLDEFSETHTINGKEMPVQIDSNEQIEREKRLNQNMDGIYKNQKLIYVSADSKYFPYFIVRMGEGSTEDDNDPWTDGGRPSAIS